MESVKRISSLISQPPFPCLPRAATGLGAQLAQAWWILRRWSGKFDSEDDLKRFKRHPLFLSATHFSFQVSRSETRVAGLK
jgi:hypothetical protein